MDVRDALLGDREPHCPGRRDELDVRAPLGQVLGGADSLPEAAPVVDDEGALRNLARATAEQVPDGDDARAAGDGNAGGSGAAPGGADDEVGLRRDHVGGAWRPAPSRTSTPRRSSSRSR